MTGSHRTDENEPCPERVLGVPSRPTNGPYRITLKTRADFQRASRGRRANARAVGLQAFLRPEGEDLAPRFGLTVTKKVGNAVERNRIKRRLRAVLRSGGISPDTGHDYVIVARRESLTVPFRGLIADVSKALDHARSARASKRPGKSAARARKSDPLP